MASSIGSAKQTCAPEDGLPVNHGSKQPHTLSISAYSSPRFGGLYTTSTLGCAFVYLINHVRAAHTEHTRTTPPTGRGIAVSHCLRSLRV